VAAFAGRHPTGVLHTTGRIDNVKTVDITPDVSLLKKAGEVNYKIPAAIAELVDNAIDARLPNRKLTVEVQVGQEKGEKRILVADDGQGMTPEEAEKAMVMAYSPKENQRTSIGEFGLGMKTASSFLGKHFEVVTTTKAAKKATRIVYDEESFLKRGEWKIDVEEIDKPFSHGTTIKITNLKVNLYAGVKDIVRENFGRLFKHFVGSGDVEILVNGDPVQPFMPDTITEYDTELDFEVNGKRVRGWAGLTTRGSGKGKYGFDLVRHNRVMAEHQEIGFTRMSTMTRIVGELHMDEFPVTNNKLDFRRDSEDFKVLNDIVSEKIDELKRESRRMAKPGEFGRKDQVEVEEHVGKVQEALKSTELQQDIDRRALDAGLADEFAEGAIPFQLPDDEGDAAPNGSGGGGKRKREEPSTVEQFRLNRVKTQLRNLRIEHQLLRLGRDSLYKIWEVEGVGNNKRLVVTTNIDHPLYTAVETGFMLWVKHNIVEAVAEFFTESTGTTDAMLLVKSDILKHVARMELEVLEQPPSEVDEVSTEKATA
jgi:anti-sigma regulatory factor (Ser/Thr protein kinase)